MIHLPKRWGDFLTRGETGWLLRHGAGLGGIRLFNIAAGLATSVLLARELGAQGYGIYSFALSWVFILGIPLQMGLPTLVMRQIAIYRSSNDSARLRGVVRWSFWLLSCGAVLIGCLSGAVAVYLHTTARWPLQASLLLVISAFALLSLLALLSLYRSIISGFENVTAGSLPDILVRPALFLLAVATASPFLTLDPGSIMALHASAALAAALLGWSMTWRRFRLIEIAAHSKDMVFENRAWFTSLWPLTLTSGAAMINSRLDIVMLGLITGPASVAVYDVGAKVGGLLMITQALLNASIAPRIARLYASGERARIQSLMVQACRLSFIPSALLLTAIWIVGPYLLPALFGPDFENAYLVSIIVGLGFLFSTGVGAVGLLLNMSGHERVTAKVVTASAAINAVLNVIFIPLFGVCGSAIANTLTVLFAQSFLWWRALSITGIRGDLLAFRHHAKAASSTVTRKK